MMYADPTSQYKYVAKPTANVVTSEGTTQALGSDGATASTAEFTMPVAPQTPTNDATHFQAPEHAQKQAALLQSGGGAVPQPGQVTPSPGNETAAAVPGAPGFTYDGKRMRKSVQRRTVDYNSSVIRFLEARKWFKSSRNQHALQPQEIYNVDVVPPCGYIKNPMNAVTTKFVRTSTNKLRCPIFCVVWTPEGRRLVTGASSGEFTLWNGLTFNFETILQAHDKAVRTMVWSHNDSWLLTGDHGGFVKYWQSNMNNVRMYEAHKDPVRGLSFSPSDNKFASCSDDGLVKVWDFYRCAEERELKGHGADVKCVDWHPSKGLIVSGSKDSQQPVKLWDPKSGNSITTLHCHKSTVMTAKWNSNGNWLVTGSRDHLLKLFDIRMMKELQTFRGHKKEATVVSWHPVHETLFASGGSDGSLMFWLTGVDEKAGAMEKAHEGIVWSLSWHPLGHILCSGSNDHTSKFWARNRPGDTMVDKYNLDIQGSQEDGEGNEEGATNQTSLPGLAAYDASTVIPGIGLPATASKVVLPDSNDVNTHLYGESNKENRKSTVISPLSTKPPTTVSSEFPYPPAFKQSIRPMIPGLNTPSTSGSGIQDNEGYKIPHPPPASTPQLRLPPRVLRPPPQHGNRPPFGNHPGNRPPYGPGHRHGFEFHGPPGPGPHDTNMNFGNFPPNQYGRFHGPPGFTSRGARSPFGHQHGPGSPHPSPRWGGPPHQGPPHGGPFNPHRPPESQHGRSRPQNMSPGQYGSRNPSHGGPWPRDGPAGSNVFPESPHRLSRPDMSPRGPASLNMHLDDPHEDSKTGEVFFSSHRDDISHRGSHDGAPRPYDIPPTDSTDANTGRDSFQESVNNISSSHEQQGGSHDVISGQHEPQHRGPRLNIPPNPRGPRGGLQESRDEERGPRAPGDGPRETPRDSLDGPRVGPNGPRDGPNRQRSDPQGRRDGPHWPRDSQGDFHDGPRSQHRETRSNDIFVGQNRLPDEGPGSVDDLNFEPRQMNDNGPRFASRDPKSPQFQISRGDQQTRIKQELKSPEGEQRGGPEGRDRFPRQSSDNSSKESPPVTPPVKQERRTSDADAPGILGDYVTHVTEMQRGILEKIALSAVAPLFGQPDLGLIGRTDADRPQGPDRSPLHRSDSGRSGDRERREGDRRVDRPPYERDRPPRDRSDMDHSGPRPFRDRRDPGEHDRDRPSFDRTDKGRREDHSPHERSDMGRSEDRQRERPFFEDRPRRRPSDMGKPGSRAFDRDSGRHSERSFDDENDLPPSEKPGLLPIPDMFLARGPLPHDGPSRDTGLSNHRSSDDWSRDKRRDHGRFPDSRNDSRSDSVKFARGPRDHPSEMGQGNGRSGAERSPPSNEAGIKPLMSLLDAPLGSPPGQSGSRGRKRSMEHEFDRPPKRMGSGDNRERYR